jgi:hypothetical protein
LEPTVLEVPSLQHKAGSRVQAWEPGVARRHAPCRGLVVIPQQWRPAASLKETNMSTNEAERAVIEHLMKTRGLDQAGASRQLHQGLHYNWFSSKEEPELKALIVAYRDTLGRDGRRSTAKERR